MRISISRCAHMGMISFLTLIAVGVVLALTPEIAVALGRVGLVTAPDSRRLGDGTSQTLCRYGVGDLGDISDYPVADLHVGWYWNWRSTQPSTPPSGIEYMPAVRLQPSANGGYVLSGSTLTATVEVAEQKTGRVWIIGNEPDSPYQDNLEPIVYAQAYHDLYAAIRAADPTARIANGGIVEVTPVRLLYLDQVLQSYRELYGEEMPVDVWNIHVYIIQEKSCRVYPEDCWGADVPPGIDWAVGELYTIDDNANLDVFVQMVRDFRAWMALHGYSNRPLIISEFGVQMPVDYGFTVERVNAYMTGTFDYLRTVSGANGYPADGYRLVQRWAWWSLQKPLEYLYSNGWLYDPGPPLKRTAFGDNLAAYTAQIEPVANLYPVWLRTEPASIYSPTDAVTVTLTAQIANDGEVAQIEPIIARFYLGAPGNISSQLGADVVIDGLAGCGGTKVVSVTMANVSPGSYPVYVVVDPDSVLSEREESDNTLASVVLVATERVFLPLIYRH